MSPGSTQGQRSGIRPDPDYLLRLVNRLWKETLGCAPISGVGLLEQGADSLLATRLALRLGEALNICVPIRTVLECSAPETLVAALLELQRLPPVADAFLLPQSSGSEQTLSFSEERMWFMHAIAPQSRAYNISLALRLQGGIDSSALSAAFDRVIRRHSVLQSNYLNQPEGVARVPRANRWARMTQARLPEQDDGRSTEERLRDHLSHLASKPFDLATDPLVRAELVHLAEGDALLILVMHHIVGDQWSFDLISRELAGVYNTMLVGRTPLPAEPLFDYNRYAAWHRPWFQREREQKELTYWGKRLSGLDPVTFHPDHVRPPQQSFRGGRHHVSFDRALIARLREFAAARGATLAMVLLAALKVLLHRHSGSTDIGIGLPIANRHHPGSQQLVGTLLNTLVLRSDLQGDPEFRAFLAKVRSACLDAYDNQDLPFEQLVQALNLPRDPSRPPLFGVMLNMLNTPLGDLQFSGLEWSRFEFDRRAAQFDLTVTIDADYDCSVVFEYATDLYESTTIRRLTAQYMTLLQAILDAPSARISALPINSEEDIARLSAWGTGPELGLEHETLPALLKTTFLSHACRRALACEGESLDYQSLERKVEALARLLRARGIGRGSCVGLCLRRTASLLIAPLAVLSAGGAWVPLDPGFPAERLAYMASDAGLDLVITESALAGKLSWPGDATILVDALPADYILGNGSEWNTGMDAGPDDPAYIIYTSGSTGRPKGVVIPHRAVCNFIASMVREPGIDREDRLLAVTTLGFDIAVLELLLPLAVGAQVVLAGQSALTDGAQLRQLLETHDVTMMQATPSTWRMLIEAGWRGAPGFRALVGGESLMPDLAVALLERCAAAWNMYGPTESTIWSSCWRVDDSARNGRISLGSPIDNTKFHVLDSYNQHCPIGVPGELCIGGAGLAKGYHGRPELDEASFMADPFSQYPDARLYRTGDKARWLNDGCLQYMGRLDFQIKVRGFRIEPGEIESRLARHPELRGSVVVAQEDRPGDVRMVAYSVPRDEMPEPEELREYLRRHLPDYMVPQHFVELDAIPVLPNGKIDRSRLPAASAHLVGGLPTLAPRNELERRVWRLWCEVLGFDGFGIDDNFFDLGGHSMLAVRLIGRIRQNLGIQIALPRLFENPTIRTFVPFLEAAEEPASAELVALQPDGDLTPIFCICGIRIYQELADQFRPTRPVYGVFVPDELSLVEQVDTHSPLIDVSSLARKYLQVIRQRQPRGPYQLIGLSFGGVLAYEISQQILRSGEGVGLLMILDSNLPGRARDGFSFRVLRKIRKLLACLSWNDGNARREHKWPAPKNSAAESCQTTVDRAFLDVIRSYQAEPLSCGAVFVEAELAGEFTSFGWKSLVPELELQKVRSDHLGLLTSPAVCEVAAWVQQRIDSPATESSLASREQS